MADDIDLGRVLSSIAEDKQEGWESKLRDYAKRQLGHDDVESFRREVHSTIDKVEEDMRELREERERLIQEKEEFKKKFDRSGEISLDDVRSKGPGRFNFDLYQLGEEGLEGEIRRINRKLSEHATYRSALYRVLEQKVFDRWQEQDAQSIRSQVYEELNKLQKKRYNDLEEQIEELEDEIGSLEENAREERRNFRESIREERRSDREELFRLLQEFGRALERGGFGRVKELQDKLDELQDQLADQTDVQENAGSEEPTASRPEGVPVDSSGRPTATDDTPDNGEPVSIEELQDQHDLNENQAKLLKLHRESGPDTTLKEMAQQIDGIGYNTAKTYRSDLRKKGLLAE